MVDARLRPCGRCQPAREPIRRLRPEPRPEDQALLRPLKPPAVDGDSQGRGGLHLGRLGLGRVLGRRYQGLHALLVERPLICAPACPARIVDRFAASEVTAITATPLTLTASAS